MANKDAEIHARILAKLKLQDKNLTQQAEAEECQRIINLWQDVKKLEEKNFSPVQICELGIIKECYDQIHAMGVEVCILRMTVYLILGNVLVVKLALYSEAKIFF